MAAVRAFLPHATIIVATHELSLASKADAVMVACGRQERPTVIVSPPAAHQLALIG